MTQNALHKENEGERNIANHNYKREAQHFLSSGNRNLLQAVTKNSFYRILCTLFNLLESWGCSNWPSDKAN